MKVRIGNRGRERALPITRPEVHNVSAREARRFINRSADSVSQNQQKVPAPVPTDKPADDRWRPLRSIRRHAIPGAFLGALTACLSVSVLSQVLMFWLPLDTAATWMGQFGLWPTTYGSYAISALLGALVGAVWEAIGGRRADARTVRRDLDLRQAIVDIAGELSTPSGAEWDDKLQLLFRDRFAAGVDKVFQVQQQGVLITLGEVQAPPLTGPGADLDPERGQSTQTVAYGELADFRFPRFEMQPAAVLLNLLGKVSGIARIRFPAHPQFSRAYFLSADHGQSVRRLFNDTLLRELGQTQDLVIASSAGGLVLYRKSKVCDASELPAFVSEAATIFRLFFDAARESGLTAQAVQAAETDFGARLAEMPGLAGMTARRSLVTRADLDAFIQQAVPRKIPANIRARVDDGSARGILLMGIAFAAFAIAFTFGFGDTAKVGSMPISAMLMALLVLFVGCCMAFFAGRSRLRSGQLLRTVLRYGQLGSGRIEKVDATGATVNGQAVALLTVRYQAQGQNVRATCRIRGHAVERAQKLADDGDPAIILYSLDHPQRIMFVDNLLSIGPQFER